MPRRPSTLHHAGRAFAALAVGAAVALAAGSSGAGADRAATSAVLAGAGSGHLPAYAGAQRPALTGASPQAAQPTFTATTGPATPPPTEPGPPTEPPPVSTAALGVLAREYTTTLSRSRIAPGEVTVQLQNEDHTKIVQTWKLLRARIIKHTSGPFNAKGTDVAMEELVLAYERLEME